MRSRLGWSPALQGAALREPLRGESVKPICGRVIPMETGFVPFLPKGDNP
ncbi:MAG: hypothetical protein ABIK30_12485 [bacterium]